MEAKMGRPAEYDFKLCEEICEQIARGGNVISVLDSNENYPTWTSFRRWKNEHPDLNSLYVNAMRDKAEACLREIDEIHEDLKKKKYTPAEANVLVQTLKWKAAKFYPKMYGAKIDVTTDGEKITQPTIDLSKLTDTELDELIKLKSKCGKV